MEPMFLKDVEAHRGDDNYSKTIDIMRRTGPEYPQILHMFAFKTRATVHLERFTQRSCESLRRCRRVSAS
jgi:hypothetical protein